MPGSGDRAGDGGDGGGEARVPGGGDGAGAGGDGGGEAGVAGGGDGACDGGDGGIVGAGVSLVVAREVAGTRTQEALRPQACM